MQTSAKVLLPVAKVLKSFGTEGEIIIRYNSQSQEDISVKRPVFIYFDGLPVPFFVESIQDKATDQALIKLSGMETRVFAEEVAGEIIYVERKKGKKSLPNIDSESEFTDITGYKLYDSGGNYIGTVNSIYPYPNNLCIGILRTNGDASEVLIPLHDDFIIGFDPDNQKIILNLPKGILEL